MLVVYWTLLEIIPSKNFMKASLGFGMVWFCLGFMVGWFSYVTYLSYMVACGGVSRRLCDFLLEGCCGIIM